MAGYRAAVDRIYLYNRAMPNSIATVHAIGAVAEARRYVDRLAGGIRAGTVGPGTRISLDLEADRLGVRPTGLRRLLEPVLAEGLLVTDRSSVLRVAPLNPAEAADITRLMHLLLPGLYAHASSRADDLALVRPLAARPRQIHRQPLHTRYPSTIDFLLRLLRPAAGGEPAEARILLTAVERYFFIGMVDALARHPDTVEHLLQTLENLVHAYRRGPAEARATAAELSGLFHDISRLSLRAAPTDADAPRSARILRLSR
ncbi:hypothetical protein GCM10023321_29520 [Pseudonocardia eucalypti]|uniref:GntR family transcriptional regulator n=2 Tax=Pseudonocardia eucalypti TaxID=648755 RepID=A0ABP9Q460_9PSEU